MAEKKVTGNIEKGTGDLILSPEGVQAQNFLAKHMSGGMFALIVAQHDEQLIISEAKNLSETLRNVGLCATQNRAKDAAELQGIKADELIKALKAEVLPLASGIIDSGAGSWSQGVSAKMADGSTLTLTLRGLNPNYVAGEEVKKVGTVENKLSTYLADNFQDLALIAQCQKGIKSKVAPSLLPRIKGKTQKVIFPIEGKTFTVKDKDGIESVLTASLQFDLILGIAE